MAKLPVDPNHQVQLAMSVPINQMPLPAAGQLKYNGCRITACSDVKQRVAFKTRNSHIVVHPEMDASVRTLPGNYVYDGEWCLGDSRGTNHTAVSGRVNSAMKTNTPIPKGLGWQFHIFDCMPLENFLAQKCDMLYRERFDLLNDILCTRSDEQMHTALTWNFTDHVSIEAKFQELLKLGYEGMIIKAWDSKYTFKKNKTWMKLKAEETADLLCVGWEEGKGKYQGMIGKLICRGEVDGKDIEVGVGTGLDDADRALPPEAYLGKVIEVKYNEVCQDKSTGLWSLFLPVFIIVREDKS